MIILVSPTTSQSHSISLPYFGGQANSSTSPWQQEACWKWDLLEEKNKTWPFRIQPQKCLYFVIVYNNKYYKIITIIFQFEAVVTHSINNTVWKKHSPKEMSIFVLEEVFQFICDFIV